MALDWDGRVALGSMVGIGMEKTGANNSRSATEGL
jgi:hypothetical protein